MRTHTPLDLAIAAAGNGLATLFAKAESIRKSPAHNVHRENVEGFTTLSNDERHLSGALMRVNHVGEVCAQGLYQGQALASRDAAEKAMLLSAAREETDHLAWCEERLDALGSHKSILNPLWYAGSFGLGVVAASFGPKLGLGFVVETERQVEAHLDSHLERLPAQDAQSLAVVKQMAEDERHHADAARAQGAVELPTPVKLAMKAMAKVMTTTAHYV